MTSTPETPKALSGAVYNATADEMSVPETLRMLERIKDASWGNSPAGHKISYQEISILKRTIATQAAALASARNDALVVSELHRLGLVIESCVRHSEGKGSDNHNAVLALIKSARPAPPIPAEGAK